jgi:hypothetical protein
MNKPKPATVVICMTGVPTLRITRLWWPWPIVVVLN